MNQELSDILKKDKELREKIKNHTGHVFLRAGAGAGKSTLIAQKIVGEISRKKSLDDIAAITFTNKSALDLKWKIESELYKEKQRLAEKEKKTAKDKELYHHISEQFKKIPESRISTIHSFCSHILSTYPLKSHIDPDARSLDNDQEYFLIKNFFEDYLISLSSKAKNFLEQNSKEEKLLNFSSDILSKNFFKQPIIFLQKQNLYSYEINKLSEKEFFIKSKEDLERIQKEWFKNLKKVFKENIADCLSENANTDQKKQADIEKIYLALKENTFHKAQKKILETKITNSKFLLKKQGQEIGKNIFDEEKCKEKKISPRISFFLIRIFVKLLKEDSLNLKNSFEINYKEIKKEEWNIIQNLFAFEDSKKVISKLPIFSNDIFENEFLRYQLFFVLNDFFLAYKKHKQQNGFLDFSDQIYYALEFVRTEEGKKKIQKDLKLLFVDEYQDTDPIQTEIFLRLANLHKDDDNNVSQKRGVTLFRVGDDKQSIYRFRGSDVTLYQQEWERFQKQEELDKAKGNSNFLSETIQVNFRSYAPITEFVNFIFNPKTQNKNSTSLAMPNYPEMFSIKDENNTSSLVHVGYLISPESKKENTKDDSQNKTLKNKKNQISAEELRQQEALWISTQIKELSKEEKTIAILFKGLTEVEAYTTALREEGISFYLHKRKFYGEVFPFNDFRLLIKFLAFPLDSISLVGFLRSPVIALTDQEIYLLRKLKILESLDKKTFPPTKIKKDYQNKINKNTREKLKIFNQQLVHFREVFAYYGLEDLLYSIFENIPFLSFCAHYQKSEEFCEIFYSLKKIAQKIAGEKKSLQLFSQKLEELDGTVKDDEIIDMENTFSKNKVHLMSIHAAKGLEFDAVFWAQAFSISPKSIEEILCQYLSKNNENKFLFHIKNDLSSSLYNSAFEEEKEEITKETIRLIYVAMTRAKEKLFLFLNTNIYLNDTEKSLPEQPINLQIQYLINSLFDHKKPFFYKENIKPIENVDAKEYLEERFQKHSDKGKKFFLRNAPVFFFKKIDPVKVTGISYFSATTLSAQKKFPQNNDFEFDNSHSSLTEEESSDIKQKFNSKFQDILWGENTLEKFSSRKRGILIHQFFEWINLKSPILDNSLLSAILKSQNIHSKETQTAKKLFQEVLNQYQKSNLFVWLQESKVLGKEIPFSWKPKNSNRTAIGYIDLLLENSKKEILLIDYKTNAVKNKSDKFFIEQYQISMSLYLTVLEKYFIGRKIHSYLYMTENGKLIEIIKMIDDLPN